VKFIALFEQEGEGCDYTIGCGMKWQFVDAADAQAAFDKLSAEWDSYPACDAVNETKEYACVTLLEVRFNDRGTYFAVWRSLLENRLKRENEADEFRRKSDEYERLKKELGR